MNDAIDQPNQRADGDDEQQTERPEVIGIGAIEHQQTCRHGAQRDHAFDRKVDRAHEDDEGRPESEAERDHRRLGDAHKIAKGQETRIDRRDHDAEQDPEQAPAPRPPADVGAGGRGAPSARGARRSGAAAEGKTEDPWSDIRACAALNVQMSFTRRRACVRTESDVRRADRGRIDELRFTIACRDAMLPFARDQRECVDRGRYVAQRPARA